jgi:hypothetical protein
MKFPKHRANCYVVVRIYGHDTAICGVFPTVDGADAFRDACAQEWKDKGLPLDVDFDVELATYYDA